MLEYADRIREISQRLLKEGAVDMIIGFRKGTVPMMNEPCFINDPADVGRLVWDSNCGINLANYITDRKERIGIVAKGCDSRNIAVHIIENKIQRDQLFIIGVPCKGMIDKRVARSMLEEEIVRVREDTESVILTGETTEETVARGDLLQDNCRICTHRNPVLFDECIDDNVKEQEGVDRYADVREIEDMVPEEKWAHFDELLSECVRCYACRNACPLCYCPTCFVDESRPQWVGKSQDPTDVKTFHFLRAYHCAGRCTDCGACERACPVGIKVRTFTKKLERDCLELFGWEAGLTLEERPPLDTYRPEDPDDFVK